MEKIVNKKALHDYEILHKAEAGLVLKGYESKAIKSGNLSLKGAHIVFHGSEPYLIGATIGKYKFAGGIADFNAERSVKLLLKKAEIRYFMGKIQEKGLTIVPISVYTKGNKIKAEIAVAKGKKQYEKKEKLKKRDIEREIERTLKQ